jgi:hypothetical protein
MGDSFLFETQNFTKTGECWSMNKLDASPTAWTGTIAFSEVTATPWSHRSGLMLTNRHDQAERHEQFLLEQCGIRKGAVWQQCYLVPDTVEKRIENSLFFQHIETAIWWVRHTAFRSRRLSLESTDPQAETLKRAGWYGWVPFFCRYISLSVMAMCLTF